MYSFISQRTVCHVYRFSYSLPGTSSTKISIDLFYPTLHCVCSDCLYVIISVKEYCFSLLKSFGSYIANQLEGKTNLTLNGFWNTIDRYTGWKLKKLHASRDGQIPGWCLDLHEASLLTIECAHLVKLDREHCLCVWALIDHFLQKLWLWYW